MVYRGIVRGKTIELEERLPYPEGQPVRISVETWEETLRLGSPAAVRKVMHELPRLECTDVDELEKAIQEGRLPVDQEGIFGKEDK